MKFWLVAEVNHTTLAKELLIIDLAQKQYLKLCVIQGKRKNTCRHFFQCSICFVSHRIRHKCNGLLFLVQCSILAYIWACLDDCFVQDANPYHIELIFFITSNLFSHHLPWNNQDAGTDLLPLFSLLQQPVCEIEATRLAQQKVRGPKTFIP